MKSKLLNGYPFVRYKKKLVVASTALRKAKVFYKLMNERRSIRDFECKKIDIEVIENLILTAATAPSGANKQPWNFCIVSSSELKTKIRIAAEQEEKISYESRMNDEWKNDLAPLQTGWEKPFLETAPYLIVVFSKSYDFDNKGNKKQNYYVKESCGIACGLLLAAIHNAGFASLTHTPSPMNFLTKLLNRPENEKPFLLIPVGYCAKNCYVPDIKRKELIEICTWH